MGDRLYSQPLSSDGRMAFSPSLQEARRHQSTASHRHSRRHAQYTRPDRGRSAGLAIRCPLNPSPRVAFPTHRKASQRGRPQLGSPVLGAPIYFFAAVTEEPAVPGCADGTCTPADPNAAFNSPDTLAQLANDLGGAILVGHSLSASFPTRAALRPGSTGVKGIIQLETGC